MTVNINQPVTTVEDERFSCNLVANAHLHILFLRTVHIAGVSLRRPSSESLRRYTDLWLPLVASVFIKRDTAADNSGSISIGLIPPIDIAWLWHCHRLAPFDYGRYVRKKFDLLDEYLDASPPFSLQHPDSELEQYPSIQNEAARRTQDLWAERYPDEPFFLEEQDIIDVNGDEIDSDLDGFDLFGSTERQATFLWQVTQERFGDEQFLMDGVDAYYKFLRLRTTKDGMNQIIVPTYQIDLIWHTHILSSLKIYDADCKQIIGRTLHHDDSLNDRAEGSSLDVAFRATKAVWKKTYGDEYIVYGGMYRGEPPKEYYDNMWAIEHCDSESVNGGMKWPVIHPEIEGTEVCGHRMMGASSTGTVSPPSWLDASDTLPNGDKCFIAAADKSQIHGHNSNQQKDDYIFGKGILGIGYYHISTKQAYEILMTRVGRKISAREADLSFISCWTCICPGGGGCNNKKEEAQAELADLTEIQGVLQARYRADAPLGVVGLPDEVTKNKERVNRYYDENGLWLFPVGFYGAGGGCGAEISNLGWGGGCGGGGACGSGGCGGGGGG